MRGLQLLEFYQEDYCVGCGKGKSNKASHRSNDVLGITEPFQLIHMNLFDPVIIQSRSKKSYCLVMVDGFSKYTWVLCLHSKDEAPQLIMNILWSLKLTGFMWKNKKRLQSA